jgi:hypothetical protein
LWLFIPKRGKIGVISSCAGAGYALNS